MKLTNEIVTASIMPENNWGLRSGLPENCGVNSLFRAADHNIINHTAQEFFSFLMRNQRMMPQGRYLSRKPTELFKLIVRLKLFGFSLFNSNLLLEFLFCLENLLQCIYGVIVYPTVASMASVHERLRFLFFMRKPLTFGLNPGTPCPLLSACCLQRSR